MFIRGISNVHHLASIDGNDIINTCLGAAITETRTSDDTLSLWWIDSRKELLDAALNIILPMSKVGGANFMILSDEILNNNGLKVVQRDPEKQYIWESRAIHYDIVGLKVRDLENVLRAYYDVYCINMNCGDDNEKLIISWLKGETQKYVKQAYFDRRIIVKSLNKDMKEDIKKITGVSELL